MILGVSPMEEGRAKLESRRGEVVPLLREKKQTVVQTLSLFIASYGVAGVRVLPTFPVGLARGLEKEGIRIEIDATTLSGRRRKKKAGEIKNIESVQRVTGQAMEMVRSTLAGCPVKGGILQMDGKDLRAERMRSLVEVFFLERRLECVDTIVAPGRGGADPHWRGEGIIRTGVPIVVDLFPRDRRTRYHSDMSRTFCVGKASVALINMYETVMEAQDAALSMIRAGVQLTKIHGAVCNVFVKRGYSVPDGSGHLPKRGFIHGTGHGLGLDIHEAPSVSVTRDRFEPGDVVTIEPGLYDRRIGGVRLEDVVVCLPGGTVRNLTRFDRKLEIL